MAEDGRPLVAVVGGGVSGLAAARVLAGLAPAALEEKLEGVGVVLLEASGRLGGKILTGELGGHLVELGPDQLLRRDPSAERLCRHLGLGDDLVAPVPGGAAVYSYGEMRPLPRGLVLGVPTDLDALAASGIVSADGVSRAGKGATDAAVISAAELGLAGDGGAERTAGSLLRERLGDEVVDRLVDPLLGGINAGGVDAMSLAVSAPHVARALCGARQVVGPLRALARPAVPAAGAPAGPVFLGLRGGLGRLVDRCRAELERSGVDVRIATPARGLRLLPDGGVEVATASGEAIRCDGVVLASPGHDAAALLGEAAPEAADELAGVPYASVAVLTARYAPGSVELPGQWSGVLVPRIERMLMTAATWLSVKWPWMVPDGSVLVRVSAGRYGDERIAGLDDASLAERLLEELGAVSGVDAQPAEVSVTRWERAFPQYRPGHPRRIEAVRQMLAAGGPVELAGAVLGGIGVPACIRSGESAAVRLAARLRR